MYHTKVFSEHQNLSQEGLTQTTLTPQTSPLRKFCPRADQRGPARTFCDFL